ncbi:hypothetical protein FIBSPDRAFT_885904 [Athelia psychrophila]|uniref:Uncharacterized protein n=1 Tax=Athelia psychrophila TaxID=1759441 RepID=A0A166RJK6_9AGAM|nr:hypothetical protein FIBSPDRAFT_885904 [Fibularhizoctonia sp. CBS 109695]
MAVAYGRGLTVLIRGTRNNKENQDDEAGSFGEKLPHIRGAMHPMLGTRGRGSAPDIGHRTGYPSPCIAWRPPDRPTSLTFNESKIKWRKEERKGNLQTRYGYDPNQVCDLPTWGRMPESRCRKYGTSSQPDDLIFASTKQALVVEKEKEKINFGSTCRRQDEEANEEKVHKSAPKTKAETLKLA